MSHEEGKREIAFQMTISAARSLLQRGLITKEQYVHFDTIMRQKYHPVTGDLFSNVHLISQGIYRNMS